MTTVLLASAVAAPGEPDKAIVQHEERPEHAALLQEAWTKRD